MKNNKRAFTIVELVIVIAVIGILAAVLIPTFSSLIEKANMNSDEAAVKNMNTYLSSDEQINGKPATWNDAVKVLSKSGLDAQNYKALSEDHYLVYDASINRVLYVEKETKAVVYPEEYKDLSFVEGYVYGSWQTLEGQMVADDSWLYQEHDYSSLGNIKVENGEIKYNGSSAEDVDVNEVAGYEAYFGNNKAANLIALEFKNDSSKSGNITINSNGVEYVVAKVNDSQQLTSYVEYVQKQENNLGENFTLLVTNDIEFNGTQWKPLEKYQGSIDGQYVNENNEVVNAVLKDFTMTDRSAEVAAYDATTPGGKYYYYGFISVFQGNYLGNLDFEDVNVVDPGIDIKTYSFGKTGHAVAAVCGAITNNDNQQVVLENIHVKSGNVTGLSRVGGLFCTIGGDNNNGGMTDGTVTIKNCTNAATVTSRQGVNQAHSTAGGIAAVTYKASGTAEVIFEGCKNFGNVNGYFAGGILAESLNVGKPNQFKNCENSGTITAKQSDKYFKSNTNYGEDTFVGGGTPGTSCLFENVIAAGIVSGRYPNKSIVDSCTNSGKIVIVNTFTTQNALNAPTMTLAFGISNTTATNSTFTGTFEIDATYFADVRVYPQSDSITSATELGNIITLKGAYFEGKTLTAQQDYYNFQ